MYYSNKKINFLSFYNPYINILNNAKYSPFFCPDQVVSELKYKNGVWILENNIINKRTSSDPYQKNYIDYNSKQKDPTIIIILESPHIKEFDQKTHLPIGPACGPTGRNFSKFFPQVVQINNNFNKCLVQQKVYKIVFMNAIQYQASTGIRIRKYRWFVDYNWLLKWNSKDKDLLDRINAFTDKIVLNLCTKGNNDLNMLVHSCLSQNNILHLNGYHPASWKNNITFLQLK